ncbi:FxLD family lanthipeptide [Streptomyces sp. NPDC058045]|uniref:FxLD family lanthipeptide n=1 Tax=Streptomyces sp. NPDC058045 TaxID=3346311 RepID=UPI0036EA9B28
MNANAIKSQVQPPKATADGDAFDLDVSVLESGDGSASLINLTDDGCRPSCHESCATNVA